MKVDKKIEGCEMEEVTKAIEAQKGDRENRINPKVFELLKKKLVDFEIVM